MSDTNLESLRRLNALCSRFERELRQGRTPDIGELLVEVAQEERGDLLRELLLQEWNARRRRQEAFGLNEYLTRFGEQRAAVESAWGQWQRWLHPPATGADEMQGAEATAAMPPQPPGYEIVGVLGRGGMGVVYRARQVSLGREVALKMILAGGHAGEEERRRFLQEAEAIARVRHPGIVQVFDYGTHEGLPYFSLELCDGGSLAERLQGTPLPPVEAARVVEQLARAVGAAHAAGVIHRDLKPANVLLSFSGGSENRLGRICDPPLNACVPKITDFGLARRLEGAALTQTGAVVGTASYMPPEQARGERVGPSADVYALGAILYECLTGRPPFQAASVHETLLQVVSQEPVPPRQVNARVPRDLETVCLECLSKEPARRYGSAEALADDLQRWLAGMPIRARPVGWAGRLGRWCRRNPGQAGLLSAVALLSALVLALGLQQIRRLAEQGDDLPQVIAELDRTDPGWRLEDLEARRAVIPEGQNSALRVREAKKLLPQEWPDPAFEPVWTAVGELPSSVVLPEKLAAAIRAELRRVAPALAEARRLATMAQGRHTFSWRRDVLSTSLPHVHDCRTIARLLEWDSVLRAHEGDLEGAIASCCGVLNVGRSLEDELVAISQFVRLVLVGFAVKALERILAQGEPPEVSLAVVQEALEKEVTHPSLLLMARVERGGVHYFMTAVEAGDVKLTEDWLSANEGLVVGGSIPGNVARLAKVPSDWQSFASLRRAHAWLLKHFTRSVEIAQLPTHELMPRMEMLDKAGFEAPAVAGPLLFPCSKMTAAYLRTQARLRCAAAGVAAERYRRAHGRWPDTLAALVPGHLGGVPDDPYDGAPLRYRRLAEGVVIYAVGPDRTDNGGALGDDTLPAGADVGFRLWDVPRRRQVVNTAQSPPRKVTG